MTLDPLPLSSHPDPAGECVAEIVETLRRLDRRLERAVQAARERFGEGAAADPYRGLYVAHDQAERLARQDPGEGSLYAGPLPEPGEGSRLGRLRSAFALSALDLEILLVALAPEIDLKYERLYAYLQDDVTRKRPTVDLALDLLCPTPEAKLAARGRLAPSAPLLRHRLVGLLEDPSQRHPPLLAKYLRADERIVEFLLGSDKVAPALGGAVRRVAPRARLDDLLLPAETRSALLRLATPRAGEAEPVVYLQGPYGAGKRTLAEALCRERGVGLLLVEVERFAESQEPPFDQLVRIAAREAALQRAAVYWEGCDAVLGDANGGKARALAAALEEDPGPVFLSGSVGWEPVDVLRGRPYHRVALPRSSPAERVALWRTALRGEAVAATPEEMEALATRFRFSAGQIWDTAATARNLARARGPEGTVTAADLYAASRQRSNQKLGGLAHKIAPRYAWDDLVLPPERVLQLREVVNFVKHQGRVFQEWGFDGKLPRGKGLSALFAGPSGTGKTMAADVIAGELGLDLYRIDLSLVVSKYIGETEKNLARVFEEAETSNAVLFFDEADALFGKRSEVKDAHDRYANQEISYLLQRMEEYEGVVVLATNLRKNMDEAFVRRMQFTVDFPFPGEAERRRIWGGIFPARLPRDAELDLDWVSRRLELTGGSIRNVALAAAFLAADDGGAVTMAHLIHAARREYQKMGKVVSERELGEFAGGVG